MSLLRRRNQESVRITDTVPGVSSGSWHERPTIGTGEAADILGLSRRTLLDHVTQGRYPALKRWLTRGGWRFEVNSVVSLAYPHLEGRELADMVKGAFESVVKRVIEMDSLDGDIVLTGGVVAHNEVIVRILERHATGEVMLPPKPQLVGAFGAALMAKGL